MYRAVFFDAGNTLLYPFPSVPEVCQQVLAQAGYTRDLSAIDALMPIVDAYYEDRYREDDTFWTDENATFSVWIGMYSLLFRELGIEEDAEKLADRVCDTFGEPSRWCAYDDVAETLRRLKSQGYATGIISNWDPRLASILDGLELSKDLDTVVSSAVVGLHKPDPRIFELACERVGVSPTEAIHVGDHHYADIVGATAVGMKAVLIDRHNAENERAIASLQQLDEYLDGKV